MSRQYVNADFPTNKTDVPKLNIATALSVTSGNEPVGWIVEHGGAWFAFTPDRTLHGEYPNQQAAMKALPSVEDKSGPRRRRVGGMRK